MPWQTLELDRETATSREVKRSYARLLKIHRPDQDPEGFRRLHDAYEYALAVTEKRERGVAQTPVPLPRVEEVQEPVESVPVQASSQAGPSPSLEKILNTFTPLEEALRTGAEGVGTLVRAAEQALYDHPSEVIAWGQLMAGLVQRYGDHRELSLKPEAMLFELQHEGWDATLQIINRMDRLGREPGIAGLSEVLLSSRARIGNQGGAMAAMRLACADAVWTREFGESLANFAYPHLSPQHRDGLGQEFERCRALGQVLRGLPLEEKLFWRDRLTSGANGRTWDDAESRRAIKTLQSQAARRWPAFEFFIEQLPPEIQKTITRPLAAGTDQSWDAPSEGRPSSCQSYDSGQRRRRRSAGRTVHYHPVAQPGFGGSGMSGIMKFRLASMVVGAILIVIRACSMTSGHY